MAYDPDDESFAHSIMFPNDALVLGFIGIWMKNVVMGFDRTKVCAVAHSHSKVEYTP